MDVNTLWDWGSTQLTTLLHNNQVVSGGIVLGAVGIGVAYLRAVPGQAFSWVRERMIQIIEIPQSDEAFDWIDRYLADKTGKKRHSVVRTKRTDTPGEISLPGGKDNRPQVVFTPAPGSVHWLKYRDTWYNFNRRGEGDAKVGGDGITQMFSSLMRKDKYILTFFSRNQDVPKQFMEEVKNWACPLDNRIALRISERDYWTLMDRFEPRPLASVILELDLKDKLLADLEKFMSEKDWYKDLGIPFRRGYLLHGPAGSGKSSSVAAIAAHLRMNIYVLRLNDPAISDTDLMDLVNQVEENSILLIEDIDCAVKDRKIDTEGSKLSFSGLLNALDGIGIKDGRITFMTSNYIDKLDTALVRPGRVDYVAMLDYAKPEQAALFFRRFYGETNYENEIRNCVSGKEISMATLQGIFVAHRSDPLAAVQELTCKDAE